MNKKSSSHLWLPKLAGGLLILMGLFHPIYAIIADHEMWKQFIMSGLWNSVVPPWENRDIVFQRNFWTSIESLCFPSALLGGYILWSIQRGYTIPTFLVWGILLYGVVSSILAPISGFWFLVIEGLLLLIYQIRTKHKH
ncbi:DUF6463 family protein [Thermoflavimicrobium daqui]|jgi:hypothetical protein|uniref:Uncharacterized protein n=1 Tax=Thermoflavimicrobium daqui TaxID=2137476 RepID=A0A364K4Z8_9BACL|nr:DUF6463 family protein [Thermoflavimicrobium daqui]RAL24454.1 hypothetical protein DL897_09045 [Thermoflavimicrobium daqui]